MRGRPCLISKSHRTPPSPTVDGKAALAGNINNYTPLFLGSRTKSNPKWSYTGRFDNGEQRESTYRPIGVGILGSVFKNGRGGRSE